MDGSSNDTRQTKLARAALGAFYGLLGGMCFAFVSVTINFWLHRDLPLGIDWQLLTTRLPLFALGLALVGAVTCWWNEAWHGLFAGAATAAALALTIALFSTNEVGTGMKFIVLVFILVPIAAMVLPIAWILRWLTEKHIDALTLNLSLFRILGLIVLILLLGAAAGYFMKMNAGQLEATRYVHTLLQNPNEADNPVSKVPGVTEHQGVPYKLYSTPSATSSTGYDIRADFEDGYAVQCTVVQYPGRPLYISQCLAPTEK
jgi:hypothetical protein